MKTSEIVYLGELRTEAVHIRSGNTIITDAPVDNHGKGEAFSPTDLVATALGSCMVSIMGILANAHQLDVVGAKVSVMKHMGSDPRRIIGIDVDIYMPDKNYTHKDKKMFEHAALTCPVAKSIHPDIKQSVNFHW
ncbi:MAG: OsmC family protein [Saprospiraceae bacterium]|jgi:putative redox protein|nr:OsmC family protein [Saprospiraceae bacterium]